MDYPVPVANLVIVILAVWFYRADKYTHTHTHTHTHIRGWTLYSRDSRCRMSNYSSCFLHSIREPKLIVVDDDEVVRSSFRSDYADLRRRIKSVMSRTTLWLLESSVVTMTALTALSARARRLASSSSRRSTLLSSLMYRWYTSHSLPLTLAFTISDVCGTHQQQVLVERSILSSITKCSTCVTVRYWFVSVGR